MGKSCDTVQQDDEDGLKNEEEVFFEWDVENLEPDA